MVTSTYPRSDSDPAVPWLREHILRLSQNGCDVEVLAPAYKGLPSHEIDGIVVHRFRYCPSGWETLTHDSGAPSKVRSLRYLLISGFYIFAGWVRLRGLARERPFDVYHIHWPFPHALFAWMLPGRRRSAVVLNFHGAELLLAKKFKFVAPILAWSSRSADRLVANSSFTRSQIAQISNLPVSVLPYGNPIKLHQPSGLAEHDEPNIKILFVGRLIERKGIEFLLDAMPEVYRRTCSRLTVVGDGLLADLLRERASASSGENWVEFKSNLSPSELADEYRSADIFCLPAIVDSRGDTEGLGVVLIEAISFGCAVVASNVGGIPDVVVDGLTGVLVEQRSVPDLSRALIHLAENPELRQTLAEQAQKYVERRFSWDTITTQTLELYHSSLDGQPAKEIGFVEPVPSKFAA